VVESYARSHTNETHARADVSI